MTAHVIADAMREYGEAMRGDWSDVDGRSIRAQMQQFAEAVAGGRGNDWSPLRWRSALGVCPFGLGHWDAYCDQDCESDSEVVS